MDSNMSVGFRLPESEDRLKLTVMLKHCSNSHWDMSNPSCEPWTNSDYSDDFLCDQHQEQFRNKKIVKACHIKVFASCLMPELSYKTVAIKPKTTSKQLISGLLKRLRLRHKDPRLLYLNMELMVNQEIRTIRLDDNTRPAELLSCNPWGESRFILHSKPGTLIRIHTEMVRPASVYRSLVLSKETTVREVMSMLWGKRVTKQLVMVEKKEGSMERQLELDQCPVQIMDNWTEKEGGRLQIKLEEEHHVIVMREDVHVIKVTGEEIHDATQRKAFSQAQLSEKDWLNIERMKEVQDTEVKINDWFARIEESTLSDTENYEEEMDSHVYEEYVSTSAGEDMNSDSDSVRVVSFFT